MSKTYDPKQVKLVVGAKIITGYAEGTFIKGGRSADTWKKQVGASGEVVRSKTSDLTGEFEITLLQTSESNDWLSALAKLDETANAGAVPLLLMDMNGTTICAAKTCWVRKPSDVEFEKGNATERKWTLDTDELEYFVGGNP